mmetsp:Transcript_97852/g.168704  ORF Transcript_97852/g.168704 Transcript_97852/m.168704 type:complete len:208 (-) Transcript_97852:497-1120(-)
MLQRFNMSISWSCVLLLLLWVGFAHCCSPNFEFWTWPTDERQARAASVIVVANVTEHIPRYNKTLGNDVPTIRATAVKYFKGCGPVEVVITGFSSSSMCGVGAPAVGSQAAFFMCASDTNNSNFELNTKGDIHLGLGRLDKGMQQFVQAMAGAGAYPSDPSNKSCVLTSCVAYEPVSSLGLRVEPALMLLMSVLMIEKVFLVEGLSG